VRIATYSRISTDEDHQPYSLEAQTQRLAAYVQSQEDWRLVRRFSDQASGPTLDRAGLQRALREAQAKRFDLLLVYRVDRLSRSVRGLAQVLEQLDQAGVAFRSASEPFDTSSSAGRMMVQMLGVFAEFERATIVERVIAAWNAKLPAASGPAARSPSATESTPNAATSNPTKQRRRSCARSSNATPSGWKVRRRSPSGSRSVATGRRTTARSTRRRC
jgi:site-specific DNA recombinase